MFQAPALVGSPPPNPFQNFKNEEDRRAWFHRNILYILSHYDQKTYFNGEDQGNIDYPTARVEKYFRYYLARQEIPTSYKHTAINSLNQPLRSVWINGHKLGTIVDRLTDTGKTVINNMKITVRATSREAQNERTRMLEALRTKMMRRQDFEEFEQFGVAYKPVGEKDKEFHNLDEAEKWANKDYQEESAAWGQDIAEDTWNRNQLKTEAAIGLQHVHIAGICGYHTYAYNGRVIVDRIDAGQEIRDMSNAFDPFHRKDQFAGLVDWITPSYLMDRYGSQLSDREKEEIEKTTSSNISEFIGMYARVPGYITGSYGYKYSRCIVYWKGKRNLGWNEAEEDKWGHKAFYKDKDGKKFSDQCVFQGTLIGNKYLVDIGVAPNQVKNPYNPGESELPIKLFTPNMVLGETVSVISKLHQLQDLSNYYTNEIKKTIARNLGKNIIFYSDAFEGTHTPAGFFSDLEQYGMTMVNRKKGERSVTPQQDDKTHEVLDMTIDNNVRELAALRAETEAIMDSIMNVTPIQTGSQSQYVSQGVQQSAIQQSNISVLSVMNDYVTFLEMVMQHATNIGRHIHSIEDGMSIPIAGDRGKRYLKETAKFSLEELGISIKVLDIIDEQGKTRLKDIALGLVQAQLFSMLDWAMIEKFQTYTEVLDYFIMIGKRQDREKKEAQEFAIAQQKIEAERQNQSVRDSVAGKLQQTQMQVDGKLQETGMKVSADMAKAGMQMEAQGETV